MSLSIPKRKNVKLKQCTRKTRVVNKKYQVGRGESVNEKDLSIPEISSPPVHDICYVWLLMKGDSYLPGIFVSVYSVLRTNPDADLVVMITDDVSEEAQTILLKVATHLFHVPYLAFKTNALKTSKQDTLYKEWKSVSYTKWTMLALPYKKALFLDGDTVTTSNLDHLFKMKTPAAPFNNPFVKPLGIIPDYLTGQRGRDGYLIHGAKITQNNVRNILNKHGMLLTASAVLLEPSFDDYTAYINMVRDNLPYGRRTCHSMVDEQSIAEFYSITKNVPWYNIHHAYNLVGWKDKFLRKGDMPYVIHYFSEKPWNVSFDKWDDFISWYKMAAESINYAKISPEDIRLTQINIDGAVNAEDVFIKKVSSKPVKSILDIKDVI
jgi:lipopolysaccharide biosynthesis glycosyltransferase